VPVHKLESLLSSILVPSAKAAGFWQSSVVQGDFCSEEEEYTKPNSGAKTTPGPSDHAACLLSAARFCLNSPPEAPKNWGQINSNLNDYHSNPMEISSTFRILDISDWWHQQEEMHSKYANLSNVALNIFYIIPNGVQVEARFSLRQDVIGWRRSKTTGRTLHEKVVVTE
jgi:hypothetical protein